MNVVCPPTLIKRIAYTLFLAVLKLVYYSSNFSRFMPHVRFPPGGGLAQIVRFPASSECFGHFSREFTHEVTATATASSITVAGINCTQTGRHVHSMPLIAYSCHAVSNTRTQGHANVIFRCHSPILPA